MSSNNKQSTKRRRRRRCCCSKEQELLRTCMMFFSWWRTQGKLSWIHSFCCIFKFENKLRSFEAHTRTRTCTYIIKQVSVSYVRTYIHSSVAEPSSGRSSCFCCCGKWKNPCDFYDSNWTTFLRMNMRMVVCWNSSMSTGDLLLLLHQKNRISFLCQSLYYLCGFFSRKIGLNQLKKLWKWDNSLSVSWHVRIERCTYVRI